MKISPHDPILCVQIFPTSFSVTTLSLETRPAIYLLLENSQTFWSELHQLIPQFL